MSKPSFEIVVSDYSTSVDEWRRAHSAPKNEVPRLNDVQKDVARKFGISEEEYARSVLAGQYGRERMVDRARRIGEIIQDVLDREGTTSRVVAVISEMFNDRWLVKVQSPEEVFGITVPRDLADDVLDSQSLEDTQRLVRHIRTALSRKEQVSQQ